MSLRGKCVALVCGAMSVSFGSLLGGNSVEGTLVLATGFTLLGCATMLFKFIARELTELRRRFGVATLRMIVEMS